MTSALESLPFHCIERITFYCGHKAALALAFTSKILRDTLKPQMNEYLVKMLKIEQLIINYNNEIACGRTHNMRLSIAFINIFDVRSHIEPKISLIKIVNNLLHYMHNHAYKSLDYFIINSEYHNETRTTMNEIKKCLAEYNFE